MTDSTLEPDPRSGGVSHTLNPTRRDVTEQRRDLTPHSTLNLDNEMMELYSGDISPRSTFNPDPEMGDLRIGEISSSLEPNVSPIIDRPKLRDQTKQTCKHSRELWLSRVQTSSHTQFDTHTPGG